MVLSDAYLADANGPIQSPRGRVDCAFDAGYHALLAVLKESERPQGQPTAEAVRLACTWLKLDAEVGVLRAQRRYSATERDDLAVVLSWAEDVRARAKQFIEIITL